MSSPKELEHTPCPTCGDQPIVATRSIPNVRSWFMAMCPRWGHWRGPYADSSKEALTLWDQGLKEPPHAHP
jgi:hypothetical protein